MHCTCLMMVMISPTWKPVQWPHSDQTQWSKCECEAGWGCVQLCHPTRRVAACLCGWRVLTELRCTLPPELEQRLDASGHAGVGRWRSGAGLFLLLLCSAVLLCTVTQWRLGTVTNIQHAHLTGSDQQCEAEGDRGQQTTAVKRTKPGETACSEATVLQG